MLGEVNIISFAGVEKNEKNNGPHVSDSQVIKMEVECSNSRPPGPESLTGEEEVDAGINIAIVISNLHLHL